MNSPPVAHHEPEIAFLARIVRVALLGVRTVTILVGAGAIAIAIHTMLEPESAYAGAAAVPPPAEVIAHQLTFVCFGVPLLVPARWLFGRGRWAMLALGLAAWLLPMLLPGDHAYGFVLRAFGSFVAVSILMVWRMLFSLTPGGAGAAGGAR